MITQRLNTAIVVISELLYICLFLYFASVVANFMWWLFTPATRDLYVQRTVISSKEDSIKYLTNSYPFGEVVIQVAAAPSIISQIRLNGVYVDGNDSFAFVDFENKNLAVNLNGAITADVIVSKITSNSIFVTTKGQETEIKMSVGKSQAAQGSGGSKMLNVINNNQQANDTSATNSIPNSAAERNQMVHDFMRPSDNGGSDSGIDRDKNNNSVNSGSNSVAKMD